MTTPLAQKPTDENAEIREYILGARDAVEGRATIPVGDDAPLVVYFSSISGNTHKFVEKLHARTQRLPLRTGEDTLVVQEPYVLCVPHPLAFPVRPHHPVHAGRHAAGGEIPER